MTRAAGGTEPPPGEHTDPPAGESADLTAGERIELERLRAEVAELRQSRADVSRPADQPEAAGRGRWRSAMAIVLIVLGSLLAPIAVTAVWLDRTVSDTDRYVATVAPLAEDPAIQRAVTDRITQEVFNRIDVAAIIASASDLLARQDAPELVSSGLRALGPPIANGIQNWTHDQIAKIVASPQFAQAWSEANRAAHTQLIAVLTGDDSGALVTRGNTVSVRLATFIETVKQRLVANGFTLAARIPTVNAEFVIFQSADIGKAQSYFRLLSTLGAVLPWLVLALLVGGVLVAPTRRRAVLWASIGVAVGMLALGIALTVLRPLYLNAVPDEVLPSDAAVALFDTVVVYLRTTLRTVLAVALVVAIVAWVSGPARGAVAVRRTAARAAAAVRAGAGSRGLRTGPVGTWVGGHKRALQAGTALLAAVVLVFWNYPTVAVVVVIAVGALLVLAIIEVVGETKMEVRP